MQQVKCWMRSPVLALPIWSPRTTCKCFFTKFRFVLIDPPLASEAADKPLVRESTQTACLSINVAELGTEMHRVCNLDTLRVLVACRFFSRKDLCERSARSFPRDYLSLLNTLFEQQFLPGNGEPFQASFSRRVGSRMVVASSGLSVSPKIIRHPPRTWSE
jgi:hypothetical protein